MAAGRTGETGFSPGFSRCWRQEAVMRAMYPDVEGFVERGGVKVGYEVFGADGPAIVLFTSWAIVHARQWKAQVPYLARHFRVIAVEGRATGEPIDPRSSMPTGTGSMSMTPWPS